MSIHVNYILKPKAMSTNNIRNSKYFFAEIYDNLHIANKKGEIF